MYSCPVEDYTPDAWKIMKISGDNGPAYKVLSGWNSGYLTTDGWRLNSGIEKVEESGEFYYITGRSGSIIKANKKAEGFISANRSIFDKLKEQETESLKIETIDMKDYLNQS